MKGFKLRKYKDHRRYSFSRTFGNAVVFTDCEYDLNLANFNQNQSNPVTGDPPLPNGCTAFTRTDIAANEDRILYRPGFTYTKSCMIEGIPEGSGLTLESSFKSGVVYGLQAVGETADAQALAHRRGPYFEVTKSNDDWFDSLWNALQKGKKSLSVGTVWFPEMTSALTVDFVNVRPTTDGHNWEVTGVTTQNGIPRMHVKWWGGEPKWFGRAAINALMSYKGSDCLIDVDGKAIPTDIQTVRLTITQVLISYMQRLLALYQNVGTTHIMKIDELYTAAKNSLGKHMTLNSSVDPEVGCAEAVSAVLSLIGVSDGPKGIAGTAALYEWMKTSGLFEEASFPEAGTIIISPTGMGNGKIPGHTGVCGLNGIMSNDSNSGLFLELWTSPKWETYYHQYGGIPTFYFNLIG